GASLASPRHDPRGKTGAVIRPAPCPARQETSSQREGLCTSEVHNPSRSSMVGAVGTDADRRPAQQGPHESAAAPRRGWPARRHETGQPAAGAAGHGTAGHTGVMRVLVTGGAGYIGSHTVLHLVAAGHEVVVVDDFRNAKTAVVARLEELSGRRVPVHAFD